MSYSRRLGPVFFLLLAETSCRTRHVAVPAPPPPAATSQPASASSTPTAAGGSETANPGGTPGAQEPSPYQVNKTVAAPPATAVKKPVRPTPAPAASATPAPASSPSPATPAAQPAGTAAPKLGDVHTPDEVRQYGAAIDLSLSHAQASLNAIRDRQLTKDQQGEVGQIRNFIEQAEASRTSDPAGAKSLAQRAEVLARDLAATFH